MEILQNLNPMQLKAAVHKDGPELIIAGAGSGKTRVLTVRIAHLIKLGVEPWNILAITFTNKAAREMKERIETLTQSNTVWVATFHSTCIRILKREIDRIGYSKNFSIYDTSDQETIIKNAIKKFNLDDKQFSAKGILHEIGRQKDELITWEQYKEQAEFDKDYRKIKISLIFEEYQRQLVQSNALDFDDIISKTVELFLQAPDVLDKYQNRFKYILVDEYQDTNTAQYKLISLLASKYKNLCVVGDDDQSIYGWRGANIKNILDFEKDYPDAFVVKLEQNYRSTGTILDAANEVIKQNIGRKGKTLWTENDVGAGISVDSLQNEYDEAYFCTQQIIDAVKNGKSYKDFAFLFRTNAQTRVVEDCLIKHNIPYKLYGGTRFYDRKEIKDILSYLRLINNITDNVALRRIINVPRRGIGDSSLAKAAMYADAEGKPMYEILTNVDKIPELKSRAARIKDFISTVDHLRSVVDSVSVVELIDTLLVTSRYMAELKLDTSVEGLSRVENVYELINKATDYEKNAEEPSFEGFLEEVALVADIDSYSEDNDMVSLMTLHSAKGLEFPFVFMCGVEEGLFPSYRSVMSASPKELEEERRLCYVGITRAKEKLYITYAKSRMQMGQTQYNSVSRFVKEIPEKYITGNTIKKASTRKKATDSTPTGPPETAGVGGRRGAAPKKKTQYDYSYNITAPPNVKLDFVAGDFVVHSKFGQGLVESIKPAGADYEVAVTFGDTTKKFMANLAKLKKA